MRFISLRPSDAHPYDDEPGAVVITKPRVTSVEAFYRGIALGIFERRREQVWIALSDLGTATSNEIFEHMKEVRRFKLRYDSNTRARLTEMRNMGVVREVGKRACRITGQTTIVWQVIPPEEYVGVADTYRCPTCDQIIKHVVPVARKVG